jgi:hypothetical protein
VPHPGRKKKKKRKRKKEMRLTDKKMSGQE